MDKSARILQVSRALHFAVHQRGVPLQHKFLFKFHLGAHNKFTLSPEQLKLISRPIGYFGFQSLSENPSISVTIGLHNVEEESGRALIPGLDGHHGPRRNFARWT